MAFGNEEMIWETNNAPLPTPRGELGHATYDEKIYVIGGLGKTESALDVVEAYDTKTNSWSTLTPLPEPLHHMTATAYEGKLYVIGGSQDKTTRFFGFQVRQAVTAQSFFFIYDIEKNEWKRGPDLPTPRLALTSQTINGTIYVIGGANHYPYPIYGAEHEWYSVNEAYDIEMGVWQKKEPMPTPRDHLQSTIIDGKIYVIGGRQTSLKTTVGANEVYDPIMDKWEVLEPLPTPRGGLGVASLNGTVFVFGGLAKENLDLDTVEQYIPNYGWIAHPPMPISFQGMSASNVVEKIYLIGGWNNHLGPMSTNISYYDPNVIPEFGLLIEAVVVPGSTTIPISGHTDRPNMDITIVVTAPNGNIVSVDQITPAANGDFMTEIQTNSPLWRQDGFYTVSAQQGTDSYHQNEVEVEIVDGAVIPEFGNMVFLILIFSLFPIVLSQRFSFFQKYVNLGSKTSFSSRC